MWLVGGFSSPYNELGLCQWFCLTCNFNIDRSTVEVCYFLCAIPLVCAARDLGVLMDSRLTFRDHIKSVDSRGHVRAIQIWRCFYVKIQIF